jgi:hypothetical protein
MFKEVIDFLYWVPELVRYKLSVQNYWTLFKYQLSHIITEYNLSVAFINIFLVILDTFLEQ